MYTVRTDVFEGPLDLLLSLIEKRKLFINDVSLAQVADDYISYMEEAEDFPISQSADFILIASTLVLIKSKSLLPVLDLTQEEEEDISNLEDRLKKYQRIKYLSQSVEKMFGKNISFGSEHKSQVKVFSPSKDMNLNSILESIKRVINSIPKAEKLTKTTVAKVISLEEMISKVTERVTKSFKTNFKELTGSKNPQNREERVEMVVGFLAILELFKQGVVNLTQHSQFSDIQIENKNIDIPKYN